MQTIKKINNNTMSKRDVFGTCFYNSISDTLLTYLTIILISICDNCKFMNRISLMLQLLLISDGNVLLVNRFIGSNDCNGSQNQGCPIK